MSQLIHNVSFGDRPYFTFIKALEHYEKHCAAQFDKNGADQHANELRLTRNMLESLKNGADVLSEMCWD